MVMAKKYAQTRKDRMDERRGEEHYEKEKRDHRYHSKKRDGERHEHSGDKSHMMGHDPSWGRKDYAGMPSREEMSLYPVGHAARERALDDTIGDIDRSMDQAERMRYEDISYQK